MCYLNHNIEHQNILTWKTHQRKGKNHESSKPIK